MTLTGSTHSRMLLNPLLKLVPGSRNTSSPWSRRLTLLCKGPVMYFIYTFGSLHSFIHTHAFILTCESRASITLKPLLRESPPYNLESLEVFDLSAVGPAHDGSVYRRGCFYFVKAHQAIDSSEHFESKIRFQLEIQYASFAVVTRECYVHRRRIKLSSAAQFRTIM